MEKKEKEKKEETLLRRGFFKNVARKKIVLLIFYLGIACMLHAQEKKDYIIVGLAPGAQKMDEAAKNALGGDLYFLDLKVGWTHRYMTYFGWNFVDLHFIDSDIEHPDTEPYTVQLMTGPRGFYPIVNGKITLLAAFDIGVGSGFQEFANPLSLCFDTEIGAKYRKLFGAFYYNQANTTVGSITSKTKFYGFRLGFYF